MIMAVAAAIRQLARTRPKLPETLALVMVIMSITAKPQTAGGRVSQSPHPRAALMQPLAVHSMLPQTLGKVDIMTLIVVVAQAPAQVLAVIAGRAPPPTEC